LSGEIDGCSQWRSTLSGTLETGWLPPIWPPVRTKEFTLARRGA
jgi:hypothetical protein